MQELLTFSPSDQELCVSVSLTNDETLEDNEEFLVSLELQDPQLEQEGRITVAPMTARVCIADDDGRFKIREYEGSRFDFKLVPSCKTL